MPRRVEYRSSAAKALRGLSRTDRERILAAIDGLPAGDVKVLLGSPGLLRLRVGTWRVIFERGVEDQLVVLDVRARGSAYKP
jgi:mRNA interferase RelE/StbE